MKNATVSLNYWEVNQLFSGLIQAGINTAACQTESNQEIKKERLMHRVPW